MSDRDLLERRIRLCQEVIRYLCKVDPGQTKKMGLFFLEYNKPKMQLAKVDLESGRISRPEFLQLLKEGARIEAKARQMVGRYTTVTARALKNLLNKMREEEEGGEEAEEAQNGDEEG